MKELEKLYKEQFEIRKNNLCLDSLAGIDGTNEFIYDAGFINGMRYLLYKYTKNPEYKFLTEVEVQEIVMSKNNG